MFDESHALHMAQVQPTIPFPFRVLPFAAGTVMVPFIEHWYIPIAGCTYNYV